MALWKDAQGTVHDDMDGTAEHLLPLGCTPITQAEADAILNPPKTQAQINADIIAQIAVLEGKTERGVREFILASLEAQAIALGAQQGLTQAESLTAAYTSNILYRKAKDVDTAIDNLRKQLVWA